MWRVLSFHMLRSSSVVLPHQSVQLRTHEIVRVVNGLPTHTHHPVYSRCCAIVVLLARTQDWNSCLSIYACLLLYPMPAPLKMFDVVRNFFLSLSTVRWVWQLYSLKPQYNCAGAYTHWLLHDYALYILLDWLLIIDELDYGPVIAFHKLHCDIWTALNNLTRLYKNLALLQYNRV